jgi:hypothetical protein
MLEYQITEKLKHLQAIIKYWYQFSKLLRLSYNLINHTVEVLEIEESHPSEI